MTEMQLRLVGNEWRRIIAFVLIALLGLDRPVLGRYLRIV
jgi:hypothetical protein